MEHNRRDDRAHASGETADLIAMRQGALSREDFERRHGITDMNDARHGSWYAETRARELGELRARTAGAPRIEPAEDPHERSLAIALDILARDEEFGL